MSQILNIFMCICFLCFLKKRTYFDGKKCDSLDILSGFCEELRYDQKQFKHEFDTFY